MENNEQLNQALTTLVNKINRGVTVGENEIPEIINQMLTFHTIVASLVIVLNLVILFFSIRKCIVDFNDKDGSNKMNLIYDSDGDLSPSIMGYVMVFSLSGIFLIENCYNLLKIIITPKLYILEYVASLLK